MKMYYYEEGRVHHPLLIYKKPWTGHAQRNTECAGSDCGCVRVLAVKPTCSGRQSYGVILEIPPGTFLRNSSLEFGVAPFSSNFHNNFWAPIVKVLGKTHRSFGLVVSAPEKFSRGFLSLLSPNTIEARSWGSLSQEKIC